MSGIHRIRTLSSFGVLVVAMALQACAVDTTPPETSIDSAPSGLVNASTISIQFSGTDDSGVAGYESRFDDGAWSPCTSPQEFVGLADGPRVFEVRAIDDTGNIDPTPARATWTADTTPPETTIDNPPRDYVNATSVSVMFSGTDASGIAGFECQIDGGGWSACTSPQETAPPHKFEVRAIDNAGNIDPTPTGVAWGEWIH